MLGPLLTKWAVDRYLSPTLRPFPLPSIHILSQDPWTGLAQLSAIYLCRPAGFLRLRVRPILPDAVDRPEGHARPPPPPHGSPPAARPRLLRPHPGGPHAHPSHHRCGRPQRVARFRPGHYPGRRADAGFVLGGHAPLSPALTAVLLADRAPGRRGHRAFSAAPPHRATAASAWPSPGSTPTCRSTSAASSSSSSSTAKRRASGEFERTNRAAHGGLQETPSSPTAGSIPAIEFLAMLALALLLAYGGFRIRQGGLTLGSLMAFFQYGMRVLPPHPGPEREVQPAAIRHGCLRAHLRTAGHPRRRSLPRRSAKPFPQAPARGRVRRRLVRLPRRGLGAARRELLDRSPARPSPWSATPALVRPPSSACCCASTMSSAAASASAASISASSIRATSAATSASCSRTPTCSPALSKATSAWAPNGSPKRNWWRPPNRSTCSISSAPCPTASRSQCASAATGSPPARSS